MAGPVQEAMPQQQATKRSAEADPEPAPLTKRPAEDPERKQQAQSMDATNNAEDTEAVVASKQQHTAEKSLEGNVAQEPTAVPLTAAEHQPLSAEKNDGKTIEEPPPSDEVEAQNGRVEAADNGPDPTAVALHLAAEAAAAQDDAQKAAKIAEEKQAAAANALQDAAKELKVDHKTAEHVVEEASETNLDAPKDSSATLAGADLPSEPQAKDVAPQAPAQPTEAGSEKDKEEPGDQVPPTQSAPVMAAPAPDSVFPPPIAAPSDPDPPVSMDHQLQFPHPLPTQSAATPTPTPVAELPPPTVSATGSTLFPPPMVTLTPQEQEPKTALTPLIGNIPPQAVESLKAAKLQQEADIVLPSVQLTQELQVEQQASTQPAPVTQPLDQGVVPMEE